MEIIQHILRRSECYLGGMVPEYITIHEVSQGTGETPARYNAAYYIKLLEDPEIYRKDPRVAYHFLCDDGRGWQFLPVGVRTAHAGSTAGNSSIGIERLVNVDIDFEQAIKNQAQLTATLMYRYNIPLENVVPHKYWSGKECPARLLAGMYGWNWDEFLNTVMDFFESKDFCTVIL
mgnify:CR=1 FL=1